MLFSCDTLRNQNKKLQQFMNSNAENVACLKAKLLAAQGELKIARQQSKGATRQLQSATEQAEATLKKVRALFAMLALSAVCSCWRCVNVFCGTWGVVLL